MGTCADLEPKPTYDLELVLTETISSVTTLDVGFEELTDGRHAIVIQASADVGGATPCLQRDPQEESSGNGVMGSYEDPASMTARANWTSGPSYGPRTRTTGRSWLYGAGVLESAVADGWTSTVSGELQPGQKSLG